MIPYRDALQTAITNCDSIAYGMERFVPAPIRPLDRCYEEIAGSQIYVLLLGHRYGEIDSDSGKSYTELEYDKEAGRNMIGITPVMKHSVASAIPGGIKNTGAMTVMMFTVLKQLFTGEVAVSELSGPVGIVYATNEAAKSGVMYVIYLAALLSLNLAILNMLPFPALDGGRLLFLVIRLFTGKRVSDETEGKIHFIGICLLFALMIYVTFHDVIRFIIPIF